MTGEPFPDRFRRWYSTLPPAMRLLLTVNTVLYVAWLLVSLFGIGPIGAFFLEYLALTPVPPEVFYRPWQLLTYAFIHLRPGIWGFIGFAFNMLWLYWLGREYEEFYGSHRLFGVYVMSALGGAVLAIIGGAFLAVPIFPVFGAMTCVLGVLWAVATINPDRGIGLLFLGVVKMRWIAWGFLVLSVLFFAGIWTYVAAYVGGAAVGYGFGRAQLAGRDLAAWARGLFPRSYNPYGAYGGGYDRTERTGVMTRMKGWVGRRKAASAPVEPERRAARSAEPATTGYDDVDRILDKISEHGYDALTAEEKRVLYEASRSN
jgi:membrane associated rhomboid family serine protease